MKIAFVTNFCSHYRVKTWEVLASYYDLDYYFFSAGDEWYWLQQHGIKVGNFQYKYLPGFQLGYTQITPTLPFKLLWGNYDLFIKCINGRFALPMTYLSARLKRKPFILWTGIWSRLQTPFHRLTFPLIRYIYRHADAIVVYGEHVKRYLISEGVHAERIFVATHTVDNDSYNKQVSEEEKTALRQQLGIGPQKKIVIYLGRLEQIKGLAYLLEAFALLQRHDTVLVLAGAGSERSRLESLAQEKGLGELVRFPGYVPIEKTVAYYAISWVYVLPSIALPEGKEPWGLVINEAFNQGLPVIATDAVGAAAGGLLQDGINGFVLSERNSFALAQALHRVLDDADLREQMSQNARRIVTGWNNERMVLGFRQAVAYAMRQHSTNHISCFSTQKDNTE